MDGTTDAVSEEANADARLGARMDDVDAQREATADRARVPSVPKNCSKHCVSMSHSNKTGVWRGREEGKAHHKAPCAPRVLPFWTHDEGAVVRDDSEEREVRE